MIYRFRRRATQRPSRQAAAEAEKFARMMRLPQGGALISDQALVDEAVRITGVPMSLSLVDLGGGEREYYSAYVLAQEGDPQRHILLDDRRAKNPVVRKGLLAHEIAHIALGHVLRPLLGDAELIRQVPILDPRLVTVLGSRCGMDTDDPVQRQEELDVELFAGRLVEALTPHTLQPPEGTDPELIGLHTSLGG